MAMCEDRGLSTDEATKPVLIERLVQWRLHALPPNTDIGAFLREASTSVPDLAGLALSQNSVASSTKEVDDEDLPTTFSAPLDETAVVKLDEIKIGRKVGSGAYKTVHKAVYRKCIVALSVISTDKLNKDDLNDIENEVQLLRDLRHDNIVRFLGVAQDSSDEPDKIFILTEFCPYGDLSDYMISRKKPNWDTLLNILHDIAFGVSYLHDRRPAIIHRDLKSLNILVDSQQRMKIADFGLSKTRSKLKAQMHSVVGTINWQAPEMWADRPQYTQKVDVYSCGLIFWEVLNWSNKYPFGELSDAQIHQKVGNEELRPSVANLKRLPGSLVATMEEMWAQDPESRPEMNIVMSRLSELMK
eukprot:Partr_v1_DN26543_c0_g1_i2_m3389 putative TKL protein kinase